MNKYGKDNFSFEVLVCGSKGYIDDLEVAAIQLYNTTPPHGYNLTLGGDGSVLIIWEESYTSLLGTMSDRDLSVIINISEGNVSRIRKSKGVEKFSVHDYSKLDSRLGMTSDKNLAKEFEIPASTITHRRKVLGISPYGTPPDKDTLPEECILLIGTMADKDLACKFNANVYKIRYIRKIRGIPRYTGVGWRKISFTDEQLCLIRNPLLSNLKVAALVGVSESTISRERIAMKKKSKEVNP